MIYPTSDRLLYYCVYRLKQMLFFLLHRAERGEGGGGGGGIMAQQCSSSGPIRPYQQCVYTQYTRSTIHKTWGRGNNRPCCIVWPRISHSANVGILMSIAVTAILLSIVKGQHLEICYTLIVLLVIQEKQCDSLCTRHSFV